MSQRRILKILEGAVATLASDTVDGIIWALNSQARLQLDRSATVNIQLDTSKQRSSISVGESGSSITTVGNLLDNKEPSILFTEFAPQRALLHDPRVAVFFSHAGPSSTNEAVVEGIPLVTLPVYFDQVQNSLRLRDAGVAIPLDKDTFTAADVERAVAQIVDDAVRDGPIAVNVRRLAGIARVAARRKELGADLIEETIADWEGRIYERKLLGANGRRRGMHLQTADARMPIWKAKNWDLMGLLAIAVTICTGVVIGIVAGTVVRRS
jgi:hypothetical protein